jgi:hypothetical protein
MPTQGHDPRRIKGAQVARALTYNSSWESLKRILYDRVSLSGVNALAGTTYQLFQSSRNTAPANTNLLNAGAMGPNERFVIQGIGLCINANSTAAVTKFLQEGRLTLQVGPDAVEKVRIPLVFLPSPAAMALSGLPNGQAQVPAGFYKLQGAQQIVLEKGNIFGATITLGANAPAMIAGDIVDVFVQLFGTYQQPIARGQFA